MSESQQPPAPRRLAPGETPTVEGHYWATELGSELDLLVSVDKHCNGHWEVMVHGDEREYLTTDFTDFYGPLTDPREARATLQTLHPQAASKSSDKPPENRENS